MALRPRLSTGLLKYTIALFILHYVIYNVNFEVGTKSYMIKLKILFQGARYLLKDYSFSQ